MRRLVVAAVVAACMTGVVPAATAAEPTVTVEVTPASPHVDETVTVSGDVTDADGQPVSGAALTATRSDSAGDHPLMVDMADSTGHYAFEDTPTVYGDVTWTVTWNGTSGAQTVTVSRKATSLSLAISDDLVRTGRVVRLTAHLGSPTTDRTVSIYAKPYGQTRRLVDSADVDAEGDLHASYDMDRRTRFVARFDGDSTYAPAKAKQTVRVRARVGDDLRGYYDTAHGYRLYHVGADAAVLAHLTPELDDVCLYFRAQRRQAGDWHTTTVSPCIRTGAGGHADTEFKGDHALIDKPYRVRAEWVGSRAATADVGPWRRLRFRG